MSQSEPAPIGVIHDIGYRGYAGGRIDQSGVTSALFTHSLRGVFGLGRSARSKVLPIGLYAVMCLPALVLAVIAVVGSNQGLLSEPVLAYTSYAMVLQAAIAIFVAVAAPPAVSLDLRFQTLTLYAARPIDRVDYVRAKYAAMATGLFIFLASPLLIMYVGSLFASFPAGRETIDVLQALVGAELYALVLAGICLVIASLTKRRGFGIAAIITVLVLSYTIVTSLQGMFGHAFDNMNIAGWIGMFSPMTLIDGVQVWAFDVSSATPAGPQTTATGITFFVVTLALIAACYRLLVLRYRTVKL